MRIQRLGPEDAALARDTIDRLKTADGDPRRFLAREENFLIVAMDDGQPVGFLAAYLLDRVDRDRAMMCLYEIAVAETHRRRGIGAALIAEIKDCCHAQNVMKMWVQTHRSNVAAMALYRSMGGVARVDEDEVTWEWRF